MKSLTYLGYGLASAVLLISVNACMKTPELVTSPPTASSSPAMREHAMGSSHGKKLILTTPFCFELV
jgi:hypothetical protein